MSINGIINKIQTALSGMRLKQLMLAVILPLTTAAYIIAFAAAYAAGTFVFEEQARSNLMKTAESAIAGIDIYIGDRIREIQLTSSFIGMSVNPDRPDAGNINKILDQVSADKSGEYENIILISSGGRITASAKDRDKTIGLDITKLENFRDNFTGSINGRVVISSVGKSPVTGYPVVLVSSPVFSDGKVSGVLGISINLSGWTGKFLSEIRTGSAGYVFLISEDGTVIFHPEKRHLLVKRTDSDIVKKMMSEKKGFHEYKEEGQNRIASYTSSKHLNWTAGVTVERSDIAGGLTFFRGFIFFITILLAGCSGALIFFLSKKITSGLERIRDEIKGYALGEADISREIVISDMKDFSEIAVWLNSFLGNTGQLISGVKSAVGSLEITMKKFERIIESNTHSFSSRFSAIEASSSASLEEINKISVHISQRIERLNSIYRSILDIFSESNSQIKGIRAKIKGINLGSERSQSEMRKLEMITLQINDIMKTIYGMANQTKIIAFNAALEASSGASAEEIIKRFSVIVSEIRRLAENVTESTDEIRGKLTGIQDATSNMVDSVNEGSAGITEVNEYIEAFFMKYDGLTSSTMSVSAVIGDIQSFIESENSNIAVIQNSIHEINNVNTDVLAMNDTLNAEFLNVISTFKNLENYVKSFRID